MKHLNIYDFESSGGVKLESHPKGVKIIFPEEDGWLRLRGIPMELGGVDWTDATHLVLTMTAVEDFDFVFITLFSSGETMETPYTIINTGILPNVKVKVAIDLSLLDSSRMFTSRTPGRLKQMIMGRGVELNDVTKLSLAAKKSHKTQQIILHDIALSQGEPDYTLDSPPIVDRLGQNKLKQWPSKTHSEEEMIQRLQAEAAHEPQDFTMKQRSRFGGDLETRFEGSGCFRTHQHNGRWYLVDPDGYRFVSMSIDCVRPGEDGKIGGIRELFEELPDPNEIPEAYTALGDFTSPEDPDCYVTFDVANLIRSFGEDWYENWSELTKNRLVDLYVNTVGNWSK